jgi:hypothetical protein
MKYALFIYENPSALGERSKAERSNAERSDYTGAWRAYSRALREAGVYLGGSPLELPETATTVRQVDGKRQIQDGPYAGTKEQLGGFILLELPSLDVALDWASRCPAAARGAVEVRPIDEETQARIDAP